MKFCGKCGKEILDEAVICPHCGCNVTNPAQSAQPAEPITERQKASTSSIVLGIIGIVCGLLLAIVGHICSIISIAFGINDCIKNRKPTGLILGIIGEVISIFSSIIGAVIGAAIF